MDITLNSYTYIIVVCIVIILSFLYNAFSERTNIPSVILLIGTGILIKLGMDAMQFQEDLFPILEVLGIVGLIMIVLEAALDLELTKEKLPAIGNAFVIALLGLFASTGACAAIIYYLVDGMTWMSAFIYATPLSILSSAIIIPSVGNLVQEKKEFHVYESTFSDILGIMQFYFLQGMQEAENTQNAVIEFVGTFGLTLLISLVASYILIFLFQNITSHVKLFVLIAILILLYAVGKQQHLSSLIIILIFGLVMSNSHIFFRGKLKEWLKPDALKHIREDFHIVTVESAFLVRTFFFVIFGITISLATLWSLDVLLISMSILASIYVVRFIFLRLFLSSDINPQLYIAPRGLITVLLFFGIPAELQVEAFNPGILLFIIIATSIVMTFALIADGRKRAALGKDTAAASMVIPPDQIYKGFKSQMMEKEYTEPGKLGSGLKE
ncbi:MAG: cation:proton antiporter [Bacteroidota bacterium]